MFYDLGGLPVIDFHTHPFFAETDSMQRGNAPSRTARDEFCEELASCGAGRFCGSVVKRGLEPEAMVREANRDMLALMEQWKGRYFGGMQVHPGCVDFSLAQMDEMKAAGVNLIGEITPYLHGWTDYSCRGFHEILSYAEEKGMAFSFHRSDNMEAMIAAHPKLTIVKAHPGEARDLDELIVLMKRFPNLMIDISGSGTPRLGMLALLCKEVGAERILFGTDYPINNPAMVVSCVMFERITDRERELILYRNAERILGL